MGEAVHADRAFVLKGVLDRHGVEAARRIAKCMHRAEEDPEYREKIEIVADFLERNCPDTLDDLINYLKRYPVDRQSEPRGEPPGGDAA